MDFPKIIKTYSKPPLKPYPERHYSPAICSGIEKKPEMGTPDMYKANTSRVKRHNLTIRMSVPRFTRLTDGYFKRLANYYTMLSLHFLHYNSYRQHNAHRVTTAMEAEIETTSCDAG